MYTYHTHYTMTCQTCSYIVLKNLKNIVFFSSLSAQIRASTLTSEGEVLKIQVQIQLSKKLVSYELAGYVAS